MRFKLRYVLVPLACLIGAALALVWGLRFRRLKLLDEYRAALESCAEEGDIICRLGDRTWSLYFKGLSTEDTRFSHMGIIHRSGAGVTVVSAEGAFWSKTDYVVEEPLREFIASARMIGLYRLNGVDGAKIAGEALKMTGRPFDWEFDLRSPDKIYCTELLYAALQTAAPEIELATVRKFGKRIIPLEAISASPLFTEVLVLR
jgi:hypothetical protein